MRFKVLGPIEATDGTRTIDLGARLPRAVLAMLLVNANAVVSLDRLIDSLWGDDPPATATAALQVYIAGLRKRLEPSRPPRAPAQLLVTRPPGYVLLASTETLDALMFEALLEEARTGLVTGRPHAASTALAQALSLWRGRPYEDVASEPFVELETARLEELRATAMEMHAEALLLLGEHGRAVPDLEQMVVEDPLRERRWELLALALYRSGRQGEALRALTRARRTLAEELGIEPSHALQRLETDILDQAQALDWRPPLETPTVPVPAPRAAPAATEHAAGREGLPLVGRDRDLARLDQALGYVAKGHGRVALVGGDPGIGKTRLTQALAALAGDREIMVALGRCDELSATPPYWPWVQVVRRLLTAAEPDVVRTALRSSAADLAQIVPEVKDLMGDDLGPFPYVDAETARTRLYGAMVGFVVEMASVRPLVVVIDDLHWADAHSLQLVRLLSGQLADTSVLLICTYRSDEDAAEPVQATVTTLLRTSGVVDVRLQGLSEDDVGRLVSYATGAVPRPGVAEAIRSRTDGNPFFVVELIDLLRSERKLDTGADEALHVAIPPAVQDVIRRRLARLPHEAVTLLGVAAVLGPAFELDVVATAAGHDDERALQLVEAALLVGVVVEDAELIGRFRFSHSLVRETLYEQLSPLRRAELHRRAGEALELRRGEGAPLVQLAHHFFEGRHVGGTEKALLYLSRAAEAARTALAFEQAAEHLRRALRLVAELPPGADRTGRELELLMHLTLVLGMYQGYASAEAIAVATKAAALSREAGDPKATLRTLWATAMFSVSTRQFEPARQIAGHLRTVGAGAEEATFLLCADSLTGLVAFSEGRLGPARASLASALSRADALAETAVDDVMMFRPGPMLLSVLAFVDWLEGKPADSDRRAQQAIAMGSRFGGPNVFQALLMAAMRHAMRGDPRGAVECSDQTLALVEKLGLPTYDGVLHAIRGWGRARLGEPVEGVAEMDDGLDVLRATGVSAFVHFLLGLLADARRRAGDVRRALEAVDQALAEVAAGERFWEAELHRLRGELLASANADASAVRDAFALAVAVARDQGARGLEERAAASLARQAEGVR